MIRLQIHHYNYKENETIHFCRMLKTFVADGDLAGSVTVKEYKGHYFPPSVPDLPLQWKQMQSFDAADNDVIICSYPKSGIFKQ